MTSTPLFSHDAILDLIWGSTDYIGARVDAEEAGVQVDPTDPATTVDIAFTTGGADPVDADFAAAEWETISTGNRPVYRARILVDSTAMVKGTIYRMFVRVHDNPETPIVDSGYVRWA